MSELETTVLRRRVVSKLGPLAGLFDLAPEAETEHATVRFVEIVVERAIDAALSDEQTLAVAIGSIHERFTKAWPQTRDPVDLLGRINTAMFDVRRAIDDASKRPDLRPQVLEASGHAMLLLSRLALEYGATSGMHPLGIAIRKTTARLLQFERAIASNHPPRPRSNSELWDLAKQMVP